MLRSSHFLLALASLCLAGCPAKSDNESGSGKSSAGGTATSVAAPLPGVRIVYSVDTAADFQGDPLPKSIDTIQRRLESMGLNGNATVRRQGLKIVVDIPGIDGETAKRTARALSLRGKLSFLLVDTSSPLSQRLYEHARQDDAAKADGIEGAVEDWRHPTSSEPVRDYYLTARDKTIQVTVAEAKLRGCFDAKVPVVAGRVACNQQGAQILQRHLERAAAAAPNLAPDDQHRFVFERLYPRGPSDPPEHWRTYYVRKDAQLQGTAIAKVSAIMDPRSHRSSVRVELDEAGKARFADVTGRHLGRKLAVVIDDRVMSAPLIQTAVPGGVVEISMGAISLGAARREASDLAAILRAGSHPLPLVLESMVVLDARSPAPAGSAQPSK